MRNLPDSVANDKDFLYAIRTNALAYMYITKYMHENVS